jgi:hypothetical protein
MLFKSTQVLCTNCGFLSWRFYLPEEDKPSRIAECTPYWRNRIQKEGDLGPPVDPETGEESSLCCICRQWMFFPHMQSPDLGYIGFEELLQSRKCPYYVVYQPGFGPEEHKELKREAETRATIRNATIIGAGIGAGAAIITQLLYYILFAPFP